MLIGRCFCVDLSLWADAMRRCLVPVNYGVFSLLLLCFTRVGLWIAMVHGGCVSGEEKKWVMAGDEDRVQSSSLKLI